MPSTDAPRHIFDSVDEMLEPLALGALLGRDISQVSVASMQANGFSGNSLSWVVIDDDRFVLKSLSPRTDWIHLSTRDTECRSVRLWSSGVLDRLAPDVSHGIIAGCAAIENYALLMTDVSAGLGTGDRPGRPVTRRRMKLLLDGLAAMHARFWGEASLGGSAYSLTDSETLLTQFWPGSWARYAHFQEQVASVRRGWDALLSLTAPDVAEVVTSLLDRPEALLAAIDSLPKTLVHSDYRLDNVAVMDDDTVVALDWQTSAFAPSVVDLTYLVMSGGCFEHRTWAFDYYIGQLAGLLVNTDELSEWNRWVKLGKLVDVMRHGLWIALFATSDGKWPDYYRSFIEEYNTAVRDGIGSL